MTTTVRVEAHCDSDTEVVIKVLESSTEVESTVIQDGENAEIYVYDNRTVYIKERPKRD